MAGNATLTIVPSRNAIPEPRTATPMTQRPGPLSYATGSAGSFVVLAIRTAQAGRAPERALDGPTAPAIAWMYWGAGGCRAWGRRVRVWVLELLYGGACG